MFDDSSRRYKSTFFDVSLSNADRSAFFLPVWRHRRPSIAVQRSNKRSRSNSATPSQCRWRVSGRHRGFVEAAAKRSSVDHVAVRIFVTISATDLSARSIEYRRSCSSNCLLINCTTGLVRPANCVAWNCRLRLSWQKLRRTDLLKGMLTVLDWVIWHHEWKESATF